MFLLIFSVILLYLAYTFVHFIFFVLSMAFNIDFLELTRIMASFDSDYSEKEEQQAEQPGNAVVVEEQAEQSVNQQVLNFSIITFFLL